MINIKTIWTLWLFELVNNNQETTLKETNSKLNNIIIWL
jgi:hypothetical protein